MNAPSHDATHPTALHQVNRTGARLACEMLDELTITDMDGHDMTPAEYCQLAEWVRHGQPYRNILGEYAAKAHAGGPEALAAFYAVIGDFVAIGAQGVLIDTSTYAALCDEADEGLQS